MLAALLAGKHVFCEKPLCLTLDELAKIEIESENRPDQQLMVGFNRRFAPHVVKMKALLDNIRQPKSLIMTVNAGHIPANHWTQDPVIGGGRIVGEACHFIDLLRHLAGSRILKYRAIAVGAHEAIEVREDKVIITLEFEDGSIGVIHYLANGHKSVPKERLEVFVAGKVLQLDNFLRLKAHGFKRFKKMSLWIQDKGIKACASAFLKAVREGGTPIVPISEIIEVSRVAIKIGEDLR